MVLQGQDFPLNAIRQQIASGIDIIVQLGRLRDKSRRVLEVSEVDGFMDGEIVLHTLYRFEETAVLDSGNLVTPTSLWQQDLVYRLLCGI